MGIFGEPKNWRVTIFDGNREDFTQVYKNTTPDKAVAAAKHKYFDDGWNNLTAADYKLMGYRIETKEEK